MVSGGKLKYFDERLREIVREKLLEIDQKFPEIKTDYQTLIFQGKGKMIPESNIREIVGDLRQACPLTVDVSRLFIFADEKKESEKASKIRYAQIEAAREIIRAKEKDARDLVYFGTDIALLACLRELEAYEIPKN